MKRWLLLFLMGVFLSGCGATATQSEFWQHDSLYKNWDHSKFSLWEYKHPTAQNYQESMTQKWWGIDIPYVPAE